MSVRFEPRGSHKGYCLLRKAGISISDSNHIKYFVENNLFWLSVPLPSCLLVTDISNSPKVAMTEGTQGFWCDCQIDEQSLFWPLLPLYYVGTISYLFKVYVEVSWYQQEINHKRLRHPNERNNLVVAFDLYEDEGWRVKSVSDEKYFYTLWNYDGTFWLEYNKNSSWNLNLLLYAIT